ncbi:hypothetical protein LguiA_022553 [Lonicera macranthoides]
MDMNGRLHCNLSEELMITILVRLPVKSLLRFKCVCKYWYALIQSPKFVSNHYHHPTNRSRLIVRHIARPIDDCNTYTSNSTREYALSMFNETLTPGLYCDILHFRSCRYTLLGPIDGLFLLHNYDNNRVAIWNPATTEFKFLPNPSFDFPPISHSFEHIFGFGLDLSTNEYKVVWIIVSFPHLPNEAALYSFATNSWRYIGYVFKKPTSSGKYWRINGGYQCKSNATYLNGCFYWLLLLDMEFKYKVLLFDMGDDEFREVNVPAYCNNIDPLIHLVRYQLTLALHDDNRSIALLIMENDIHSIEFVSSISLCLLNNQEEEEGRWNKLYTIQLAPPFQPLQLRVPLGLWKNSGIFFQDDTNRLVLYNINTHEIIELGVRTFDFCSCNSIMVFNYKESLVSVGGGKKDKSHAMVRDFLA